MSGIGKFKIRFNLGKGENFMKWKIETPSGRVSHHAPDEVILVMKKAKLKNNKTGAQRIHDGSDKFVVAWIEADNVIVLDKADYKVNGQQQVSYNPRIAPHWRQDNMNVDNATYDSLVSFGNKIFTS